MASRPDSKSVVIIGAGIIGLCTAYYAQQRGFQVTVVDRRDEESPSCSTGNAGMVVPSHFVPLAAPGMVKLGLKWMFNPESPFYIKPRLDWELIRWAWFFNMASTTEHVAQSAPFLRDLNFASRAAYEQLTDEAGLEFGLQRRGLIMYCNTQKALDEESHAALKANELGVPAEILDAKSTAALDPGVSLDVAGSVYFPKDCHLDPAQFLSALRSRIVQGGGQILSNMEVSGWRQHQGKIEALILKNGAALTADEYVLCGGSWSPELVKPLGLSLPMQAGKGYSLTLNAPPQRPELCSIFTEARVAITPLPGGRLRFGGTMEIAGLNEDINPVRVRGIVKSVSRYFPAFTPNDFKDVAPWRGLRPCSPDGLPYVGRFGVWKNLSCATGHAMMGLSLGPITGQLMANILTQQASRFDMRLLSPDRYQ